MKLSHFITEHIEELLVEWESFAPTLMPAAESLSPMALRDHAIQLLYAIARDMEAIPDYARPQEQQSGRNELQLAGALRGALRQTSDFTLLQVCAEFRALRASVLRLWLQELDAMTENAAYDMLRFNAAIDQVLTEFVAAFSGDAETTQRLFQGILGVAHHALYTLSPRGEITHWNAGAEKTEGYSRQEVIGTHFERFFTPEARSIGVPMRALETAMLKGRFESEGWRVRKDGSRFWAHVVIDPILRDANTLVGYATVTRDLTEPRAAAAALETAREALFQSQKLQALGQLTGGVAHDFNNLLAVIVSGSELLSRETRSPAGSAVLASMQRAASRGSALTQQLLSFARQQPLLQDRFNVNQLIRAFESVLRRAVQESVQFLLHLEPHLWQVMVDPARFEAGLLNLVTNSRDAMPQGGTLSLRSENVRLHSGQVGDLPAGRYVKVTLSDSGFGMTADVANRALEPFFTTKPMGKGTGMGLSQVYGFLRQSGGDMTLKSHPSHGTAVALYLPALEADETAVLASPETNAGRDKALVVDDEPDVLNVTVELFKTMGYHVLSASDGVEALETINRNPDLDVLFSDIRLPGVDGMAVARAARRKSPSLKVILMSGHSAPSLPVDDAGLEGVDFLAKPFHLAEVVRLLRRPPGVLEKLVPASVA